MKVLLARLYEHEQEEQDAQRAASRKNQIGSGDRSERIRTYNFPQGRVNDHRINLTMHKLERVINGQALGEVIAAQTPRDQAARPAGLQVGWERGSEGSRVGKGGGGTGGDRGL